MTHRFFPIAAILLATLTGCASPPGGLISSDPNVLRIGEEPTGYPRTTMKQLAPNVCQYVTDTWEPDVFKGQVIWLLHQSAILGSCPEPS